MSQALVEVVLRLFVLAIDDKLKGPGRAFVVIVLVLVEKGRLLVEREVDSERLEVEFEPVKLFREQVVVPFGRLVQLVVEQAVRFALVLGQVVGADAGDGAELEFLGGEVARVPADDRLVGPDYDRLHEPEPPDRFGDPGDSQRVVAWVHCVGPNF
ncbi:MAG: hypothetical protein PHO46_03505 [Thermoguttaceae bacterium]|nr:hypothetical protein [Thermoguttaceae bacterium]